MRKTPQKAATAPARTVPLKTVLVALDIGNSSEDPCRVIQQPGEAVLLVRSLDRKTPPQVADRLNHDDIYLVVPATTTRYTVVGVN